MLYYITGINHQKDLSRPGAINTGASVNTAFTWSNAF